MWIHNKDTVHFGTCYTMPSISRRLSSKRVKLQTFRTDRATVPGNRILPFDKIILVNKLLFMHSIAYNYAPLHFLKCAKKMRRHVKLVITSETMIFFILPPVRVEFSTDLLYIHYPQHGTIYLM
jgi:hypothetical protein